ncbi:GNAT family N-acetyltransferase [Amycolatopsis saalfeldensis]|uniref:N-acetylglutamate synthase, GNAT family n=1 Tax=Amycolatopsis saalfeldensis TaxID=394193 RepID=A0A1H8QA43_9PSEU|nr:GNAT family N-acetyltransferase [Amycolatopsis saalfeldensis]SEO51095.1 N-acetylglutamate synthase, GNAT family [Amycolatopsis saalfeldensis]
MISIEPWDAPDAVALRRAQRDELDARYETAGHEAGPVPTAESITVFLVARDEDGKPTGCGGLRRLGPGEAEIKRMYVVPGARGSGLATRLLRALEEQARGHDITRLLLETGVRQPEAIRFYEREGYRAIDAFGAYREDPLARCYAREITAVTPFGLFTENAAE